MMKRRRVPESDAEIARLSAAMRSLPEEIVAELTAAQLRRVTGVRLHRETVHRMKIQWGIAMDKKRKGTATRGHVDAPNPEEIGVQIVLERIARIVTKSYAHLGDGEKIGTEEALSRVYAELKMHDPAIIERNEKRSLPR